MNKKANFLLVFIAIIFCGKIYAQDSTEKVLIGRVEFSKNIVEVSESKVEAALALIEQLTRRFVLIPNSVRDSVARSLAERGEKPSLQLVGNLLGATKVLFFKVSQFVNILRVDIASYDFVNQAYDSAFAYSNLRYRLKDKNAPLYDPSLLLATQRAIAVLYKDTSMFDFLEGKMGVRPVPTLVIGTIRYVESDSLRKWDIFQKRQVTSFFAIETIFEEALNSKKYFVVDNETRDSIYAFFNFFEPENFNPITKLEIEALQKFEISDYVIIGEFFFDNDIYKPKVNLLLCKIVPEGLRIEKQVDGVLERDEIKDYGELLKKLTKELLE